MKKRILTLIVLVVTTIAFAQNSKVQSIIYKQQYTIAERDAMSLGVDDRKQIYVVDTGVNEVQIWDGDSWETLGSDNLGNHTATTDLNLGGHNILSTATIAISSDVELRLKSDNDQTALGYISFYDYNTEMARMDYNNMSSSMQTNLGADNTIGARLSLFGGANAYNSGSISLFNGNDYDTTVESYTFYPEGDFKIYTTYGQDYFVIDDATGGLTAPLTSVADITTLGDFALITKQYGDANYGAAAIPDDLKLGDEDTTNGSLTVHGNSTTTGGKIIVENPADYDTEINDYSWETINGNAIFKANGGTNGTTTPIWAVANDDLILELPRSTNAAIDAGSPDAAPTKRWVEYYVTANAGGSSTALETTYDNTDSGLTATNVKDALDELDAEKVNLTGDADDIILGDGSTTSLSALDPNADVTPQGQVYVNNFDDLTGLTTLTTNGTVTIETPIGTRVPEGNALTIEHTSAGNVYAAVDLGQTYDELYIQYYTAIIKSSTATSYTDNFKVGAAANGSEICEMYINHGASNYRFFGFPNYLNLGRYLVDGVWTKIGMYIDRVAQTCDYYIDGRLVGQVSTNDQDMQWITLGGNGDNVSGYKVQFAGLSVNELAFQDFIDDNGIGEYQVHYFDNSIIEDQTGWSGMHSEPFDPDGGSNYIDGPAANLKDLTTNYIKAYDQISLAKGSVFTLDDLTESFSINISGVDVNDNYTVTSHGTGDLPILSAGMRIDSGDWSVYDAGNNIYAATVNNLANEFGVWVDETLGLSKQNTYTDLESLIGSYHVDGSTLYVRMWDDSDPATHDIDIASNKVFNVNDYCQVSNIHFRYSGAVSATSNIYEYNEFTKGSGFSVSNYSIFRRNHIHDQWGGKTYYSTPTRGNSGSVNGLTVRANGTAYYNTVEDCYINIQIPFSAENSLTAFNDVKNAIVNSVQISGEIGNFTQNESIKVINNTIFNSPRHVSDDPYPLTTASIGHGIVVQNGNAGSYFEIVNNLVLTHVNESVLTSLGGANCISISNENSFGRTDFNAYYITPYSDSNAYYFTSGLPDSNDIDLFRDELISDGWYGFNGEEPEVHSRILLNAPVVQSRATESSGKFLNTNATPLNVGGGYPYDFSAWGITETKKGKLLTDERNIGAN